MDSTRSATLAASPGAALKTPSAPSGLARLTAAQAATPVSNLASLPTGTPADVVAVRAPGGRDDWAPQLEDLGFVAGERVMVLARTRPGGDPMVVRVGLSTYALRRAEAACIEVRPPAALHA